MIQGFSCQLSTAEQRKENPCKPNTNFNTNITLVHVSMYLCLHLAIYIAPVVSHDNAKHGNLTHKEVRLKMTEKVSRL